MIKRYCHLTVVRGVGLRIGAFTYVVSLLYNLVFKELKKNALSALTQIKRFQNHLQYITTRCDYIRVRFFAGPLLGLRCLTGFFFVLRGIPEPGSLACPLPLG
jgi:hypothetical protein